MAKPERIYWIHNELSAGRSVSNADVRERWEVGSSTASDDLRYLNDRLGAPMHQRTDQSWTYREGEKFHLPSGWVDEEQARALAMVAAVFDGLTVREDETTSSWRMLVKRALGSFCSDVETLLENVDARVIGRALDVESLVFVEVIHAVGARQRLRIKYRARMHEQDSSERVIEPHRLLLHGGNWYVQSWCCRRDAWRNFALDAIAEVSRETETFSERARPRDDVFGIYFGDEVQEATLWVSPIAARWIRDERWCASQQDETLEDGALRRRFLYADTTEVVMMVARHGPEVLVESPASLRDEVHGYLARAVARYRGEL